jgi:hypothetical protein
LAVLDPMRRATIDRLRAHWVDTDTILKNYEKVYSDFVASANPGGFLTFLRNAKKVYWQLGDSLSKIDHAINCWEIRTKGAPAGRLPYDRLEALLDLLQKIMISTAAANSAAA